MDEIIVIIDAETWRKTWAKRQAAVVFRCLQSAASIHQLMYQREKIIQWSFNQTYENNQQASSKNETTQLNDQFHRKWVAWIPQDLIVMVCSAWSCMYLRNTQNGPMTRKTRMRTQYRCTWRKRWINSFRDCLFGCCCAFRSFVWFRS